jgi:hypothetical protein
MIFQSAAKLSRLIERRTELHNMSAFSSSHTYSILEILNSAGYYTTGYEHLSIELKQLYARFGLKYWPKIEDVVAQIASDACDAEVYSTDSMTQAGTLSRKQSKKDFLKAFHVYISNCIGERSPLLPQTFKLSDKSTADIMNCVLELDLDKIVNAAYVKNARHN